MNRATLIILLTGILLYSGSPVGAKDLCCRGHGGICGCSCCDGSALGRRCSIPRECIPNPPEPTLRPTEPPAVIPSKNPTALPYPTWTPRPYPTVPHIPPSSTPTSSPSATPKPFVWPSPYDSPRVLGESVTDNSRNAFVISTTIIAGLTLGVYISLQGKTFPQKKSKS